MGEFGWPSGSDPLLLGLIDQEYTRPPFNGSRKMVVYLGKCGHSVNRKRVQRLMRSLGLAGMAPGPNTSRAHPQHKVYPYLLRGVAVDRPNQVWSTDITNIRLAKGFVYLVAIIDWYSRQVLSWRIGNTMEAAFCVDCLEDALRNYGRPEIFNTDQGSQFTSEAFTGVLKRAGVVISMDGRGRAFDLYLCRASLAQRQARGRVPQWLLNDGRLDARADQILCLLQRRAAPPVAVPSNTASGMPQCQQRRPAVCQSGCNLS